MSGVLIDLGIIKIYWYSILIFISFFIGGTLCLKEANKWKIPENFMINMFFYLIPISIIGARLYYVLFNISEYSNNWIDIFKTWEGGLAIHGGILFGCIFVFLYCKKYKVKFFRISDIMVLSLILGQAIGRWGNFFNQEAHGGIISLENLQKFIPFKFIIDRMNIGGQYYQPTFLYESVWCLIGFIIILFIRRINHIKLGQITSFYLIWYGIGRFFIEGLRTDSLMIGNIRVAQIVSLLFVAVGLIIFVSKGLSSSNHNYYNSTEDTDGIHF